MKTIEVDDNAIAVVIVSTESITDGVAAVGVSVVLREGVKSEGIRQILGKAVENWEEVT